MEHKGHRRSPFFKISYQKMFVSLVVSCLLFSAQFSQATSKLCGFQFVKFSRKGELISNTTGYVPPRETFNNLLLNIKKRTGQKVQGGSQAFTIPHPMSRLPPPAKMSPTVLNLLITTILSCQHFFYPHLRFCCYVRALVTVKHAGEAKLQRSVPN